MSTNYERGSAFERRVGAHLHARGYEVFRAAGSRGKADVLAIRPGQILLIQCKRNGEIPRGEWNDLYALAERIAGSAAVGAVVVPLLALMPGRRGIAYRQLVEPAEHRQPRNWVPWTVEATA